MYPSSICSKGNGHRQVKSGFPMSNILPFKRPTDFEKHKGKTLCRSGFHKWEVVKDKQFDVKQGKLVTVYKCKRCGEQKVEVK